MTVGYLLIFLTSCALQENDRQLAGLHFKIGLTLQYLNQPSEALAEVQKAVKICQAALQGQKNDNVGSPAEK